MMRPGRSSSLSDVSGKQLALYALAAGAAGVGVLATAKPLTGEIVYTPANITINIGESLFIDLNQDGISEFRVKNSFYLFSGTNPCASLGVTGDESLGAGIITEGRYTGPRHAARLPRGAKIGDSGKFAPQALMGKAIFGVFGCSLHYDSGNWLSFPKGTTGFLGLRFSIDGQPHYGWARFSVQTPGFNTITATLTGYAYETVPGKSIKAGQTHSTSSITDSEDVGEMHPSTLGALAAGAAGLDVWRREENGTHAAAATVRRR